MYVSLCVCVFLFYFYVALKKETDEFFSEKRIVPKMAKQIGIYGMMGIKGGCLGCTAEASMCGDCSVVTTLVCLRKSATLRPFQKHPPFPFELA